MINRPFLAFAALLLALPAAAQTRPERLDDLPAGLPRAIAPMPLPGTELDPFTAPAYVRAAQETLRAQGLYRGPINGQADAPGFADALRRWQRAMGFPATGILDEPSAVALAHGLRPAPAPQASTSPAPL
jgi:peptidoglycan hydrolase-like protein with peptidoglycan-binding domain